MVMFYVNINQKLFRQLNGTEIFLIYNRETNKFSNLTSLEFLYQYVRFALHPITYFELRSIQKCILFIKPLNDSSKTYFNNHSIAVTLDVPFCILKEEESHFLIPLLAKRFNHSLPDMILAFGIAGRYAFIDDFQTHYNNYLKYLEQKEDQTGKLKSSFHHEWSNYHHGRSSNRPSYYEEIAGYNDEQKSPFDIYFNAKAFPFKIFATLYTNIIDKSINIILNSTKYSVLLTRLNILKNLVNNITNNTQKLLLEYASKYVVDV